MAEPAMRDDRPDLATRFPTDTGAPARAGFAVAIALMVVALAVPALLHWNVHANRFPPLSAMWRPRVGPGTVPALGLGIASVVWGPKLAESLSWRRLLLCSFGVGVAWLVSLATVDGWAGIGAVLDRDSEYLGTARHVTDISATLHHYIDRIPAHSSPGWPVHIAGHPPGALLFFVGLSRIGLGSGLAAGWVVLLIAATTPAAVLITLHRLGAGDAARRVATVLVLGPAAIWMAVSADTVFGAVAAWALCCLAAAATAVSVIRMIAWSLLGGLLLGCCVMLSYGLALLAILVLAVLLVARNLRPLPWVAAGAVAVLLGFAAAGFSWWQALPVVRERYYAGIAAVRPATYWVWGDLAALCFSAGPLLGASVAVVLARCRTRSAITGRGMQAVVMLPLATLLCVVLADLSLMSKAEVERIWLPFVPWLLVGAALLSDSWRRRALAGQVALALAVQTLLFTHW